MGLGARHFERGRRRRAGFCASPCNGQALGMIFGIKLASSGYPPSASSYQFSSYLRMRQHCFWLHASITQL